MDATARRSITGWFGCVACVSHLLLLAGVPVAAGGALVPARDRTLAEARQGDDVLRSVPALLPILYEKSFNPKLSGHEVYCTAALLLPVMTMLCRKLHCQKVSPLKLFFYQVGALRRHVPCALLCPRAADSRSAVTLARRIARCRDSCRAHCS